MELKKEHQYRRLLVWQRAMGLTVLVYDLTKKLPKIEQYCLIDQIRRAVISIPLNIAEGSGSTSNLEFIRFLSIARRSAYEVSVGLEIAEKLQYVKKGEISQCEHEIEEICSMITGLEKHMRN
jgi:four helix bundle protein